MCQVHSSLGHTICMSALEEPILVADINYKDQFSLTSLQLKVSRVKQI